MNAQELKMLPKSELIRIRGANEHNLKNISLDIPRNKFVVLTIIIVLLSIIYAWTNKAIKQYNFTNNKDIITEEKWEENFDEETNLGVEESGNDKDEEGDGIESDDSENGKEGKEC